MIAICVSGIIDKNYKIIIDRIKSIFPYPIFFQTWNGRALPDVEPLYTFDEPIFNYHPMLDVNPPPCGMFLNLVKGHGKIKRHSREKQTLTSATQILGHCALVESIPPQYKTIIRLRYDTIISSEVDFSKYIKLAEKGTVVGFGNFANEKKSWKLPKPLSDIEEYKHKSRPRCHYNIWDNMIFHPRDKCGNANKLFQDKKLLGMEWGWYQVLCDQWNSTNYINVNGGVMLEKLCTVPIEEIE